MTASFEQAAKFEHGFWLQVLGDHSRFIHDALAPSEKEDIARAAAFIRTFDRLSAESGEADGVALSRQAAAEAESLRSFKLHLIKKHLVGKISIRLGPVFLNHMVNEVEEYIRILQYLQKGEVPPIAHPLHHHLLWLLDASGHAGAINDNMDQVEKKIKAKSAAFAASFEQFYLKAVELAGFLRTNLAAFPALEKFNLDASLEIMLFMGFLKELEELELTKQALGTFDARMADHMAREECYYLTKLSRSAKLPAPNCDPAKPRVKS
jgi:hypothetical protein